MQLKRLCTLIVFFTQILISSIVLAADSDREVYQVKIRVSGNERLRTELASALTRELRLIHDISIVDENREWIIEVVALAMENKQGYETAYACSVTFLRIYNNENFIPFIKTGPYLYLTDPVKYYQFITKDLVNVEKHFIFNGGRDEIPAAARYIAAKFYMDIIEETRKALNSLRIKRY